MDPSRTLQNKIIYKKKILTFGNVVKAKPIIIIVAKENTSFQIYREIKDFVDKNDIKTFYLNGKSAFLKKNNFQIKNFQKFDIKKIKRKIRKSSYVSFDIFDTILNRRVIRPHDIFHLIEFKIIDQLNLKIDFASKRIRIENLLFEKQKNTYNLDDVYDSFHRKYKINRNLLNKIRKIEIDFEIKFSEPRNEIVKIYKYCRNLKKKIFFISDIYFDSNVIKKILKKNNIPLPNRILLSSKYKKSKIDGSLFEYFKSKYPAKNYLHFGDNEISDNLIPVKYKMDTVYFPSNRELFYNSELGLIQKTQKNPIDLLMTGLIVNRIFKNFPLNLIGKDKQILINDYQDFGYIFFGPLIFNYIFWLIKNTKSSKISKILFCARDGYFLKIIYDFIIKLFNLSNNSKSFYLKTSRRTAVVPSFFNIDDILKSFKRHRFFGDKKTLFQNRFGIKYPNKNKSKEIINSENNYKGLKLVISENLNKIIDNSKIERKNYINYLNSIIKKKDRIAISDQGFYGTVQHSIEKILKRQFFGYYLCSYKNITNNKRVIKGCYDYNNSNFKKMNFMFETVFTAPYGTYLKSCANKKFTNDKKMTNQKNFRNKELIIEGIKNFLNDLENSKLINSRKLIINTDFSDNVFSLLNLNVFRFSSKISKSLYFDNNYVGRKENRIIL